MKEIGEQRRRFGYRRIGVLLARECMVMNKKKLYRLYAKERLAVRKCKGPQARQEIASTDDAGDRAERALEPRFLRMVPLSPFRIPPSS